MTTFTDWINALDSFVWGPAMLVLILGTGLYLQVRLGGMPVRKIGAGLRLVWSGRGGDEAHGEVSPYAALMTCLAATIGVGNIAGVATAVALGGPGAVFWMWMTALVGMATKYAEVLLAVHFRERDEKGRFVGGPMYAIRNGLGPRWAWLGTAFALFGGLAGFGIGNMVQSNSIAAAMQGSFNITPVVTGVVLTVDHRCGHPRRHQAHRLGRELARAVHGDRLRDRGDGRAGLHWQSDSGRPLRSFSQQPSPAPRRSVASPARR